MLIGREDAAGLLLVAAGASVIFVANPEVASAHERSCDAVENGEQVYEDTTGYDDARIFAQGAWDAHISINIRHDDWLSITDVEWGDYSSNSSTWGVFTCRNPGADDIRLNSFNLNGKTQEQKRYVALHEEGHSLRIAHTDPPIAGDLMNGSEAGSSNNTITSHTHCDYHNIWGTPDGHANGCGK